MANETGSSGVVLNKYFDAGCGLREAISRAGIDHMASKDCRMRPDWVDFVEARIKAEACKAMEDAETYCAGREKAAAA